MHSIVKTVLVALISICATVAVMLLVWNAGKDKPLLPDNPPDTIDENAVVDDASEEKITPPSGGSGLSLEYAKDVSVDLNAGNATLYFKNAGKSLQDAVISVIIQDTLILRSDLLPPGSTLTTMPLLKDGNHLQKGIYTGSFVIQFFDENGEASYVNSRIEGITITVN